MNIYKTAMDKLQNNWLTDLVKVGHKSEYSYSLTKISPVQFQVYDFNTRQIDHKNIQGTAAFLCSLNSSRSLRDVEAELQTYPQYVPITIKSDVVVSGLNKTASLPPLWKKIKSGGKEFIVRVNEEDQAVPKASEGEGTPKTASVHKKAYFVWRPGDKRSLEEVREEAIAILEEEKDLKEVKELIEKVKAATSPQEIEDLVSQIEYLE